jgi:hypothetical protein
MFDPDYESPQDDDLMKLIKGITIYLIVMMIVIWILPHW